MTLNTPVYNLRDFPQVYEPSEDTFLFLDALETEITFLSDLQPKIAVEIGSGSGVIISALASLLKSSCVYFATDINVEACSATKETARLNNIPLESLHMDLLFGFKNNMFDIILFNPPYVVTDSNEVIGSGLSRAWAGGVNGREIIDKVLCNIPKMLSAEGVCYLLLLKENNPSDVAQVMKSLHFGSKLVFERKVPGEHLYIYKFFRMK